MNDKWKRGSVFVYSWSERARDSLCGGCWFGGDESDEVGNVDALEMTATLECFVSDGDGGPLFLTAAVVGDLKAGLTKDVIVDEDHTFGNKQLTQAEASVKCAYGKVFQICGQRGHRAVAGDGQYTVIGHGSAQSVRSCTGEDEEILRLA